MPSVQRGSVRRQPSGLWAARWYDHEGARRQRGGFPTRTEAVAWLSPVVFEVSAVRRGDPSAKRRRDMPTLAVLADEYLAAYTGEANSKRTLRARLDYSTSVFGDVPLDRLDVAQLTRWRSTLPERSAWAIVKALRQVLNYAVRAGLLTDNPARHVPNPEPKRREVPTFANVAELEAVAAELPAAYRAVPLLAGLTGLRPEEWIALERGDLDRDTGLVRIRRVYTDGRVKLYGKQAGSLRAVPLPARAVQALAEHPARLDTRLVFRGARGGHLNLNEWRRDTWTPALRGAGLDHRGPYALRHTYASLSIAAGVSLFELSRFMGTSAEQIDKTYGHLLPDSHERARAALDSFVANDGRGETQRTREADGEPAARG
jgi:integrase